MRRVPRALLLACALATDVVATYGAVGVGEDNGPARRRLRLRAPRVEQESGGARTGAGEQVAAAEV